MVHVLELTILIFICRKFEVKKKTHPYHIDRVSFLQNFWFGSIISILN